MKRSYKAAIILMTVGFVFWLLETITFLIIEGWHYRAISEIEMGCDLAAELIMRVGLFFWVMAAAWVVNAIYKEV